MCSVGVLGTTLSILYESIGQVQELRVFALSIEYRVLNIKNARIKTVYCRVSIAG